MDRSHHDDQATCDTCLACDPAHLYVWLCIAAAAEDAR
eukprot:CAMPEP_0202910626 /NCGR_PEP_ID=MMETSP1392-20130828/52523_1 /ASSEMBLY_ACC=CAM_ASM_000868 /TAXON_ID=225041 /ORGANISM="Chlamydomonas chlamydogama, Strain SAG 11-48b" /LENGTH=37 /DNA_ID= /DNA_START= /DNA_END= /DNA_ORIENTATION=